MEAEKEAPLKLYDGGKSCTLFVIDFGDAMFNAPGEDSQKYFRLALKSVRSRVNFLCCTGSLNELVALLFINTLNTNSDAQNVDCIFVTRPVSTPDAEFVKELDSLLANEDPRSKLGTILGTKTGTCNWGELLFLCQRMLNYCGVILRRRQIFFFTVDENPLVDDKILRSVRSYVSDLRACFTQISVCLVNIAVCNEESDESSNCGPVDVNPFWHEIDSDVLQSSSFVRLQNEVMRKDIAMRTIASIPMRLGDSGFSSEDTGGSGLILAIGVYCLIKEQSLPTAIPLDGDTNEQLQYRVHYVAEDGNIDKYNDDDENALMKQQEERFEGEINFAHDIGGETVVLNRSEMENLRRFDDPGLTVIGFKPLKCLKHSHRMGPSKYVFPLENVIGGSATLYRALFQKCIERELFILARYTEKRNTPPQLVALMPQRRSSGAFQINEDYRYEGFHLVVLPYAEDKRSLEDRFRAIAGESDLPHPTEEKVNAAKAFVNRLTTKYAPYQFANPVLQRFYSGLEAMALDLNTDQLEENSHTSDKIRPYFESPALQRRVAQQLNALKQIFPGCVVREEDKDTTAPKNVARQKKRLPLKTSPPTRAKRGHCKKE